MKNLAKLAFYVFGILVFLGILSSGCAGVNRLGLYNYTHLPVYNQEQTIVYPVYVDKDFGEADQVSIAEALDQWNYVLNGHAKLVIVSTSFDMEPSVLHDVVSGRAFAILRITSGNPMVIRADEVVQENEGFHKSYSLGFTPDIGDHTVYLVRDRIPENDMVKGLMMHELGHALGSQHHPGGLMNPSYDKEMFQCVDYDTAADVAKYNNWKVATLNYCTLGVAVRQKLTEKALADKASGKDQKSLDAPVDIIRR